MYTAIKGIYENGTLTLLEPAPDVDKAEVVITFLAEINSKNVEAVKACLEPLKENAVIRQLLNRHVEQFSHKVFYLNK